MKHIMLDLETLGTRLDAPIISIGACEFDDKGTHRELYAILKLNQNDISHTDMETVMWWMKQDDAARSIFNAPNAYRKDTGLKYFWDWMQQFDPKGLRIWSHGAGFDIPIMENALRLAGDVDVPWGHRDARDTRTIFDLSGVKLEDFATGTKHNALDDAIAQAKAVIEAYRVLGRTLA